MKRFLAYVSIVTLMLTASVALLPASTAKAGDCGGESFFLPRWYDGLCNEDGSIMSPNGADNSTVGDSDSAGATQETADNIGGWLTKIALNLVTILLTIVGYVSLGFIIYGGFKYMTSGDNSSGTVAARKTITNAVIGLILSIMSVAIVKLVAGVV